MIHHGDLFAVLPTLAEASIDAGVTDPPYGIGFMAKQWDTFNPEKARASKRHAITVGPKGNHANPNVRGRRQSPAMSPSQIEYNRSLEGQRGFQEWTERWAREVYRVLKPGAYLVVCGAPRSHHRMMCGLEDAGFVVRDCFAWLFGSGFPKNYNLGDGKGTALKPAHEPIALAWKPFKGSIKACHAAHGTAALNIDACRVQFVPSDEARLVSASAFGSGKRSGLMEGGFSDDSDVGPHALGRWPANVLLDDEAAAMLDEQSGDLQSGHMAAGTMQGMGYQGAAGEALPRDTYADVGGASRFYYVAKPSNAEREYGLHGIEIVTIHWSSWGEEDRLVKLRVDTGQFPPRVIDVSGTWPSSACEWSTFLFGSDTTGLSLTGSRSIIATATRSITASKTLSWLVRSLTSGGIAVANGADLNGGSRVGSAASSSPSLSITNVKTEFPLGVGPVPSAVRLQINGNAGSAASHPTVKPVELMRWLVKLVTPLNGTVLDPFTGSGTTGMACRYEQRGFIGIEREAEYVAIAERRIAAVAPLFGDEVA